MRQADMERKLEEIRLRFQKRMDSTEDMPSMTNEDGGPGSGNFGHAGRKGKRGGSLPGSGSIKNRIPKSKERKGGFTSTETLKKTILKEQRKEMKEQGIKDMERVRKLIISTGKNQLLKMSEDQMFDELYKYAKYKRDAESKAYHAMDEQKKKLISVQGNPEEEKKAQLELDALEAEYDIVSKEAARADEVKAVLWKNTEITRMRKEIDAQEKKAGEETLKGRVFTNNAPRSKVNASNAATANIVKKAIGISDMLDYADGTSGGRTRLTNFEGDLQDVVKDVRKKLEGYGLKVSYPAFFKGQEPRKATKSRPANMFTPDQYLMKAVGPDNMMKIITVCAIGGKKQLNDDKEIYVSSGDYREMLNTLFETAHRDLRSEYDTSHDW